MQIRLFRQLASPIAFLLAVTGCGEALFLDPAPNALAAAGNSDGGDATAPGVGRTIELRNDADGGAVSSLATRPGAAWTTAGAVVFYASESSAKPVVRAASCDANDVCVGVVVSPIAAGTPKAISAAALGNVVYATWSEEGVVAIARCVVAAGLPPECATALRSAQTDVDDPSVAVHPPTGEVFVAVAGAEGRHGVLRCDGGLSSCTYFPVNVFSGLPAGTGLAPRITMHEDPAQPRYHILSHTTSGSLYELSCDLNGTSCLPKPDVSAKVDGVTVGYAGVVDDAARRFVGVAAGAGKGIRSFSFLVDYDAVTLASSAGGEPAAVDVFLDASRVRLVVAAGGGIVRCASDGSNCTTVTAPSNAAASSAAYDQNSGTTHVFSVQQDGALALAKVGP